MKCATALLGALFIELNSFPGPSVDSIFIKDEPGLDTPTRFAADVEIKRPDATVQDTSEAISKWPCSDDSDMSASDLVMENMEEVSLSTHEIPCV